MKSEYRIVKAFNEGDADKRLSLQEVYLDDDGCMVAHTIDNIVNGDDIDEMEEKIREMVLAFNKPILLELKGFDDDGLD